MEWELKYPKVTVQPLIRDISDHTPLLLDTGLPSQPKTRICSNLNSSGCLQKPFMILDSLRMVTSVCYLVTLALVYLSFMVLVV
jgi:hypothetical protein